MNRPGWDERGHWRPTYDEAINAAAGVLDACYLACDAMTPREQAEAAWSATSPFSVDELEQQIRDDRDGTAIPESDQPKPAKRTQTKGGTRRPGGA